MCSIRGSPESTQNHAYYLLDYTEQMHIYIYMCTQIYNHTQICIYIHMHWYPYRYTLGVADKFMACGKILGRWISFQAHLESVQHIHIPQTMEMNMLTDIKSCHPKMIIRPCQAQPQGQHIPTLPSFYQFFRKPRDCCTLCQGSVKQAHTGWQPAEPDTLILAVSCRKDGIKILLCLYSVQCKGNSPFKILCTANIVQVIKVRYSKFRTNSHFDEQFN